MKQTKSLKFRILLISIMSTFGVGAAHATNGMNMEGYGPISTAMGGASQAFDNGTAAMANNPATLSLMSAGTKAEVALGLLGPSVTSSMSGMPDAKSGGTSYYMPAMGWTRSKGDITYGVGVFAQGGMGTEYDAMSFMGGGTGEAARSELGVGRVIFPVSVKINNKLNIGGSFDVIWAGLDMAMVMTGQQINQLVDPNNSTMPFQIANDQSQAARISFSNDNDFTGAAKASGTGAKIGFTYDLSEALRVGGSYHSKTNLDNLTTSATGAVMSIYNCSQMGCGTSVGAFTGKMSINDFQWPETYSIGAAWQQSDKLMLAADIKHLGWKNVMESFKMTFTAGDGSYMNFALPQNWKNQTVVMLGAAYKVDDKLTLRGGLSLASNPIPDATLNPLFPAIVKNHMTAGFGYAVSKSSAFHSSITIAPSVTATNSQSGVSSRHSQTNFQFLYSLSY